MSEGQTVGTGAEQGPNSPLPTSVLLNKKAQVFHYALVGHSIGPCGPSGIGEPNGNDFMITLGCGFKVKENTKDGSFPAKDANNNLISRGTVPEFAGTFAHELGHNLGLKHGGPAKFIINGTDVPDSGVNCKPNYPSPMAYGRQIPIPGGLSASGFPVAYSDGSLPKINETELVDAAGLPDNTDGFFDNPKIVFGTPGGVKTGLTTGAAIDWDNDPATTAANVSAAFDVNDLNIIGCGEGGASGPGVEYFDRDDWKNLVYDFRGADGNIFDGYRQDPRRFADLTESLVFDLIAQADWFDGILPPIARDGSSQFRIETVIPFTFQLWTCNYNNDENIIPFDPNCIDLFGIKGTAETLNAICDANINDPFCEQTILATVRDKDVFLRATKITPWAPGFTFPTGDGGGSIPTGKFEYHGGIDGHYHLNLDTAEFAEFGSIFDLATAEFVPINGPGPGKYGFALVLDEAGTESLFVDLGNFGDFSLTFPEDKDVFNEDTGQPGANGVLDDDAGEDITVILELVE